MQTINILKEAFQAESNVIALYLAMSRKADEEGHEEIALYFRKVAMDEALHAAEFAVLLGKVLDTRSNLEIMLKDEIRTEKERAAAAQIALNEGDEDAFNVFQKAMRDEGSHTAGLKQILSKIQEKN